MAQNVKILHRNDQQTHFESKNDFFGGGKKVKNGPSEKIYSDDWLPKNFNGHLSLTCAKVSESLKYLRNGVLSVHQKWTSMVL